MISKTHQGFIDGHRYSGLRQYDVCETWLQGPVSEYTNHLIGHDQVAVIVDTCERFPSVICTGSEGH